MRTLGCWVVLCAMACGGEQESAPPSTTEEVATEPSEVAAVEGAPSEAVPEEPPEPESPPVNLLSSVSTQLAASSVYRDHPTQIGKMLDGDTETAWNSRTGDLVGAWIEVRVPDDAQVTGAAMIVGFTHANAEGRDLFVANPRVTKVRVSHGEEVLGEFELDPEVRTLQPFAFEGVGGVFRVEVLEVLAGSNESWRETCISEFQLMGRAPNAGEGRLPTTAVGELPPVPEAADPDEVRAAHRQRIHAFARTWLELEDTVQDVDSNTGEPDPDEFAVEDMNRFRRRALSSLADYIAPVDGTLGDPLRAAASAQVQWGHFGQRRDVRIQDLVTVSAALTGIAAYLDTDEARCRTARALGSIHVRRLSNLVQNASTIADMDGEELGVDYETMELIDDANRDWSSNTRGMATRLARIESLAVGGDELGLLKAQITIAQASCGWD